MKLYQVALFACLWIGCTVKCVGATELYVLEVSSVNAPPRAWDKIQARSLYLLSILVNADPLLAALGPGEAIPYADDDDNYDDSDPSNATAIPGGRDLQAGGQCPPRCEASGSNYCKSIGCAYCGSSCSRRKLQGDGGGSSGGILSEDDIMAIEARIDDDLKRFCKLRVNCSITSNVYWVNADGSTSPVTDGANSTAGDDAAAADDDANATLP